MAAETDEAIDYNVRAERTWKSTEKTCNEAFLVPYKRESMGDELDAQIAGLARLVRERGMKCLTVELEAKLDRGRGRKLLEGRLKGSGCIVRVGSLDEFPRTSKEPKKVQGAGTGTKKAL